MDLKFVYATMTCGDTYIYCWISIMFLLKYYIILHMVKCWLLYLLILYMVIVNMNLKKIPTTFLGHSDSIDGIYPE
jgi:hypothetical protein